MESKLKKEIQGLTLLEIESIVERKVIADIRKRQKRIPGLKQDDLKYTACWGKGDLTPGCRDCCLKGRWTLIRTTSKCNLNCSFCYYFKMGGFPSREMVPQGLFRVGSDKRLFSEDDIKLLLKIQSKKLLNIKGVAWLFGEPLIEIDKMLPIMKIIHKMGYHQWLYTNGIYATKNNLIRLKKAGLDEIRFNLAATNCSDLVLKNMKIARNYFKYLCIESPMFTQFFNSFVKKRKAILDTGVDHIHFAELQLSPKTIKQFKKEGPVYRYKNGYVSPIKSRQLTYDIFDIAVKEKWKNVVLHDCSNEKNFIEELTTQCVLDMSITAVRARSRCIKKLLYKHNSQ